VKIWNGGAEEDKVMNMRHRGGRRNQKGHEGVEEIIKVRN
jgi:hypothetical protein